MPTPAVTVQEDCIVVLLDQFRLIDGTGNYFLDMGSRVFRYVTQAKKEDTFPYITNGGTVFDPKSGTGRHPNMQEEWLQKEMFELWTTVDKDNPGAAKSTLVKGFSDMNTAIGLNRNLDGFAGDCFISNIHVRPPTDRDMPLLDFLVAYVEVWIDNKNKAGNMRLIN